MKNIVILFTLFLGCNSEPDLSSVFNNVSTKITAESNNLADFCKKDVTGKIGEITNQILDGIEQKTELQKPDAINEKNESIRQNGYCGKVTGKLEDIYMMQTLPYNIYCQSSDSPYGSDSGYLILSSVDNTTDLKSVTAHIFFKKENADKLKNINKNEKATLDVYFYGISGGGAACLALK